MSQEVWTYSTWPLNLYVRLRSTASSLNKVTFLTPIFIMSVVFMRKRKVPRYERRGRSDDTEGICLSYTLGIDQVHPNNEITQHSPCVSGHDTLSSCYLVYYCHKCRKREGHFIVNNQMHPKVAEKEKGQWITACIQRSLRKKKDSEQSNASKSFNNDTNNEPTIITV